MFQLPRITGPVGSGEVTVVSSQGKPARSRGGGWGPSSEAWSPAGLSGRGAARGEWKQCRLPSSDGADGSTAQKGPPREASAAPARAASYVLGRAEEGTGKLPGDPAGEEAFGFRNAAESPPGNTRLLIRIYL